MTCISSSALGFIRGTLTPKGFEVAALTLRIWSRSTSGVMLPAPRRPRPPCSLTAAVRRQPLHQTMPPAMTGYCIPKSSVMRLFIVVRDLFVDEIGYFEVGDAALEGSGALQGEEEGLGGVHLEFLVV